MPRQPDFPVIIFALKRIFRSLGSTTGASGVARSTEASGVARPTEASGAGSSHGQVQLSESQSRYEETSPPMGEGGTRVSLERSRPVQSFPEEAITQAFANLPQALSALDESIRTRILEIHITVMAPVITPLSRSANEITGGTSYHEALVQAEQAFNSLQLPPQILAGLRRYYDVCWRLSRLSSSINAFAYDPQSAELSADHLPISPKSIQWGIFALFLFDLPTVLQSKQVVSFPDIVRFIPADYLYKKEGDTRPVFFWDNLFKHFLISGEFRAQVETLLRMLGYLPTLTRAEQLAFFDLYLGKKGFQPSDEEISTIHDPALQVRIRSIDPSDRRFLAHVNELFALFPGLMQAGLCPLVGFHKKESIGRAIEESPPDFFTPTSPHILTSKFGPDNKTVLGTDGKPLELVVQHRGMFYQVIGDLLRHPCVNLFTALELAETGGLISWLTWAKRARALASYYDAILSLFCSGSFNIESVYSKKEKILACYSSQEGWSRFLSWILYAGQAEYKRHNQILDPWRCIKAVRERINQGIADVPYALWYIAPFETVHLVENLFYKHKLRNFLVSSLLLDFPFFKRNPTLYSELRRKFFQDNDHNDPYSAPVGGLVLAASLPYLSSIFHPDHGVSYVDADGKTHNHVVTLTDLCLAAGVKICPYQVGGVTYLTLGPSTVSSQYPSPLRSEIVNAINEWVHGTKEDVPHKLRPDAWNNYADQPEIYEMVMRFLLQYWYPANRTVEVIPASLEPGALVAKIQPVVCDPQGAILVARAPVVAGPVYGQGGPAQLCEDVIDIVTSAPYATVLGNLPYGIRRQVDIILQPRLITNSNGDVATDPKTKKPIYFVRCPNADYQYSGQVKFGEQLGTVPSGYVPYRVVMSILSRDVFSIPYALARGNKSCRLIPPGSDESERFRPPLPLCSSHLTMIFAIALNSSELWVREAFRFARVDSKEGGIRALVKRAEEIWADRFFYNSCFSPADLHRAIVGCEKLPPDLKKLLLESWNVTLEMRRTWLGREHIGSLVGYGEILHRLGGEDPDLKRLFESGISGRALEAGAEVVGDLVPSFGLSFINRALGYIAKSGKKLSDFIARDAYRFALPVIGSSGLYFSVASSYAYYPVELLVYLGFIVGSGWCVIPILKRRFPQIQEGLRSLAACASGCAVYDSQKDVGQELQKFAQRMHEVY